MDMCWVVLRVDPKAGKMVAWMVGVRVDMMAYL